MFGPPLPKEEAPLLDLMNGNPLQLILQGCHNSNMQLDISNMCLKIKKYVNLFMNMKENL